MNPAIAAAVIFAVGGVLLAVCGIIAVRALRQPVADRARLDAFERLLDTESKALRALIAEANQAAVDARRWASSRTRKKERADAEVPELADEPAHVGTRVMFRPGCDQFGNPCDGRELERRLEREVSATALAARGLRVVNGAIEKATG